MASHHRDTDDNDDSISHNSSEKSRKRLASMVPGDVLADAELVTARGNVVTKDGIVISANESDSSISTNVFRDPEVKAYYIGVYEKAKYECRHVFDAEIEWTKEEERKLVRKLDLRGPYFIHGSCLPKRANIMSKSVSGLA